MKRRLLALGLVLCLTAALTACGGGETPAPTGDVPAESLAPSDAPSTEPSVEPDAPAVEHETLPTGPAGDPSAAPEPSATPAPSAAPSEGQVASHPIVTPAPSETPSEAPSEEPSEAPAKSVTAAEVYAAVSKAAGVSYDDISAHIDAYYTTLNTGDLADYVFYQPSMSAQIEEIFIAKVNAGKMDAVKAACKDRQAAMVEQAAFYVGTGDYVDSYQLVSEGDWVLFCVGADAAGAADAFKDAVK